MYIGAKPNVANYTMLDSITTSATTTFNLTKDGVAFFPENPLGVICSLNGVIQKAGSSFNIVNSTIVFASTLASTDVIDFILVMAQKIDLNTPADSSVTNAKTNFVSSSSSAGLQIKGDGTTDGTLQLNCSQNSHGIKLKSPPHSASASYTLTFPTTDGNADEFLKTDGSGSLSWATAGGNMAPMFSASLSGNQTVSDATTTKVNFDTEEYDSAGNYDHSTNYRFTPTTAGKYLILTKVMVYDSNGRLYNNASYLRKNGSTIAEATFDLRLSSGYGYLADLNIIKVVSMNGSSDYLEMFAYIDGTGTLQYQASNSYFQGYKIIE